MKKSFVRSCKANDWVNWYDIVIYSWNVMFWTASSLVWNLSAEADYFHAYTAEKLEKIKKDASKEKKEKAKQIQKQVWSHNQSVFFFVVVFY